MVQKQTGTEHVKRSFPEMLKGGVICDVVNAEQARIAEEAGASAVMALERVPADIRAQGGVARMSDPELILQIKDAVTIPVMAKCRIGHFVEAEILQAIGVDCIDESEVLTPADEQFHVEKRQFSVPFVCGARDLGEALRRVNEGAAMLRTKGEAGSGNIVEAVRHMRGVMSGLSHLHELYEAGNKEQLKAEAKEMRVPYSLVREVAETGKLPVVNFSAGGVATPADAALMMKLGAEGIFVGSGIFKSSADLSEAERREKHLARARAIVEATTHFEDPEILARVSRNLGAPMVGINLDTLPAEERMAVRGW
jgi:pyridoxal 5'-phosphate synthase pdxS subunit